MSCYDLQPGDLVKVKRWDPVPYWHWGVYIGDGMVMHLSGAEFNLAAKSEANVHRVTLKEFIGDSLQVERIPCPSYVSRKDVVKRAKSAENSFFRNRPYDLLTNNCEHFARWCHGVAESQQVQEAVTWTLVGGAVALGAGLLIGSIVSSSKEEKKREDYY